MVKVKGFEKFLVAQDEGRQKERKKSQNVAFKDSKMRYVNSS